MATQGAISPPRRDNHSEYTSKYIAYERFYQMNTYNVVGSLDANIAVM